MARWTIPSTLAHHRREEIGLSSTVCDRGVNASDARERHGDVRLCCCPAIRQRRTSTILLVIGDVSGSDTRTRQGLAAKNRTTGDTLTNHRRSDAAIGSGTKVVIDAHRFCRGSGAPRRKSHRMCILASNDNFAVLLYRDRPLDHGDLEVI